MNLRRLIHEFTFPDPREADAAGLVAFGGSLDPRRVLAAYAQGIFPWPYDSDSPVLWFSPDPRMVLRPSGATTPRLGVSPRGLSGVYRAPRPLRRHAVASHALSRNPCESAHCAHASRTVELENPRPASVILSGAKNLIPRPWRERAR